MKNPLDLERCIKFTQCDGSVWIVPFWVMESIFVDEQRKHNSEKDWTDEEVVNYHRYITWREVERHATMIQPPPVQDGPDYDWGWRHADMALVDEDHEL